MISHKVKSGFTIVEMLMVIAVLAVLTGIVTTAASSAIRQARNRRIEAVRQVIQAGIATYNAQKGYWPPKGGKLQSWCEQGLNSGKKEDYLTDSDYDNMMREMVKVSVQGNSASPVLDPSAFIVIKKGSADKRNVYGQEFREAIKKNKKHGSTLSLTDMAFGYQETSKGYFRRYVVCYNGESDTVKVMTQDEYYNKTGTSWK